MNKKEILMICLIICFIFSLQAVSASDVELNTTDDNVLAAQIDDAVSVSNDLSSYSLPDDNSIVRGENDGAGSFSELQTKIDNDDTGTITLDKNYTYDDSSDSGLKDGIVISKNINIVGNGFTIDALSSARIFNIETGSTVTLTGINFVNGGGASVDYGGSIYSSAQDLTIEDCTFKGSYASEDGGALYISGDGCKLLDSTFIDNSAGDDGGAINWNGDYGTIDNINCYNNTGICAGDSNSRGGTISLTGSNINISRATITLGRVVYSEGSDITKIDGGAMFITGDNVNIADSTFTDCTASNMGGAIYTLGDNIIITDATFTNNYATEDGGAIYILGNNTKVCNSTFTDNSAGDDGGAMCWNGNYGTIYNITCTNNTGICNGDSNSRGGTISLTGNNVNITSSTITSGRVIYSEGSDMSKIDGGAMFITGDNIIINDTTFTDCSASNDGGALYVLGNDVLITNSIFTHNNVTEDGGALYILGNNTKVCDSTLTDNSAGDDGGAIFWQGHDGIIDNCIFENNIGLSTGNPSDPSTSKGGTISITGDNIDIYNSNITGSVTKNRNNANVGGAIFITGNDIDIDHCNFDDCTAEGADGGTIYIIGARTTITSSNFTDSEARSGGAIYIEGVDASVYDSHFTNTHARTGTAYTNVNLGGAIYIKGDYAKISGSEFESSGAYSGGIIYLQGSYCDVNGSSFTDGYASNDGGAIYSTGSYSNVIDSNFTDNLAEGNAGAIYWYGGTNSKYNTIAGSIFLRNVAHAKSTSNTRGGGAVYWSENGNHGSIVHSQFINNSVQSNNKADGGAILWDRCNYVLIDYCTFDGNYITTTATGDVWVQGGALYLRADSRSVINNSVFKNSVSDKEAGAIYVQSKTLNANNPILIVNTQFINNTAKAIAPNVYGGGAVQVKECNQVYFINATFINNTANNGGAMAIYKANNPIQLTDCVFVGNNATNNGGSIWAQSQFYIYNTLIANSTAGNFAGGLYTEANMIHDNLTFINNTALNGGGLYWTMNNANVRNMVFLNNTALQYGGAMYISRSGHTLTNINMTGNKAFSGSAIYSTAAFKLIDSYLIENQANSSSLTFDTYNEATGEIVLLFKGKDKYLNAIYITGSNRPTCTNVAYWDENGISNTGASAVTLPNAADPTPEAGQNITVEIYDDVGTLLTQQYFITDKYGKIHMNLHDLIPDVPPEKYGEIYVEAQLTNEDYYTMIKLSSRVPSSINATATNTTYHSNSTLSVNVTSGATGNVSVYLNDTFLGNITLDSSRGSMELSTLIEGRYLPAGNHTLLFVYNGNAKYDKSNTTAILEISKITPALLINVTGIGYNLVVNVTALDERYGIADVTGNVTIEVAGRTTTIYLANGQGMTIIYGLPIGNYTVNATYNGDNNYYSTTNSTYGNVTEKTQTVLVLELDNERTYFINETVPIKVTILPEGEGNITLYINGEPHVLTLQTVGNSTFVEFNATDLKDGINYVFATYEGTELYAPSWAESSFNVVKYNATVGIETANITLGDTEVINITLPEDATGILNVTVNGTSYYVEITNGNATLALPGLNVGVYNVTVTFDGDKKYYNATNSTLFNVSKATPGIIVSVENITYGQDAVVIVTVPEGVSGNVTITLNGTVVFTQEPIDGQAVFAIENLAASNYTIEATFNGNENYTSASNSTNFTVFKATPLVNLTVENIYYGDAEHIIIKVNAEGNVTVKVNGEEIILNITSSGNDTYVYGLAVGNYPVEVTFNGNENYTDATVTGEFNVYEVNTPLTVDVHDILVWSKESINVTLAENVTGDVIININGVNYTVPITNGTAQLNLTDLDVGHKVVWVFYDGDRNYTANRTMAEFDVGQRTPLVNVTALNITVDQDGKITINIPANATGFVVLSGNFTQHPIYVDEFTNGVAEVIIGNLAVGDYDVHIKYYGDALDNYTVAENDTTFTVGKTNATLSIDVDNVTYGNDVTIVVTVPEGVTGNITLKLNDTDGRSITLPIEGGKVTWTVEGLAAGNYTVNATYNGNDDYNIKTESAKFEVRKADPELDFIATGTVYDNATVMIYINDEIHGKVANVTIDGVLYPNVSVDEAFITHVLTEYKPYTVIVEYAGNENFTGARVEHTFTPSKVTNFGLNITAMNITVGDDEIITVEVPDGADDVVIWVAGQSYRNSSFTGNKATFNITGLKEGIYTVTAFVNDTEFDHRNFTSLFTVNKTYPSINITVVNDTSIYVGDTVKVIVTVPEDVTENVTIEINGMEFTNSTVNGNATFYIPAITFGNKTVVATYPGDDKYRFNSTTAQFTVNKRDSYDIIVDVTEAINVGDIAQVNVTLPTNATGQVVVKVDGQNYTINLTDGKGSVEIKGLLNGTYPVEVTYLGDDQYASSSNNTQEIKVNKIPSSVTVTVDNITVGDVAAVNITVITNATGNVTIVIGDEYNKTVGVVDGQFSVIVPGLSAGDKTVTVTYNGDDRFLPSEDSANFNVGKATAGIDLVVENITYGEIETIVAYINATGNVTIKLNDYEIETVPIVNGKVEYPIEGLNAGNYTVEVIYNGDAATNSTSAKANFTVAKADPIITIEVQDIIYGDVEHIVVHVNAEGNVTIIVNGQTVEELTLENGRAVLRASRWGPTPYNGNASLDVYNLAVGNYPVEVTFNGNQNYNTATATDDFDVLKDKTSISVEYVPSMEYGESQLINITLNNTNASGEVIINVDGKNYTRNLTDGKANFTIEGLAAGNHTVVVIYEGDRNLTGNWTSLNIEVTKITPEITVNATNITVGDKTLIEVTAPSDVTRPVLVDVGGVGYYVNITDGKGTIEVPISKEGTYNVTARYLGDDKYAAASANNTFKVSKLPSSVNVTVENITVGDKAIIEIAVPSDATGNVTVTVDGKDYNVSVSEGKGTLVIPDLKAGDYPVSVKYLGDDKYEESTNATEFTVSKIKVDIQVIDQNNGTLTIVVGDNATGNVTVKVGDEIYNATVIDGVATVDMVNNTPGTYDVEVIYSGDDRHTNGTATSQATIPKLATPISVTVENIKVGDKENIVVTVPDDATGNVTIEINGVKYTEEIKNGKATFEIENLAYGNKTVYVDYIGDNNYTGNHTSANFTVDKRQSTVKVDVEPINVGEDAVITVTVPQNATGYVIVEIDNQTYAIEVKDGTGSATIKGLASGDYPINVTYLGDDQYFNSTNATSLKVSKVPSSINVTVENITVGENAVINIEVPKDVCGNVTVSVDGKNYTVPVSGGQGTLVVPDLGVGNHTVDVKFEGCKKYEPSENSTNFTVSKVKTNETDIKVFDQGNGTVVVVVPDDATGTVEIKVGDHIYNATIEDGVAVIDLVNETPGTYDLNVTYSGDENHTAANTTGTATIPKLATPISVEVNNIHVGDTEVITVTVPENATGNVTIEIDGVKYTSEIKDGKAVFNIKNLTAGNKTIAVDYVGDDNYLGNHTTSNFTVSKCESQVSATITNSSVGENVTVTVTVPQDATGQVLIDIDGVGYYVNVTDGTGTIEIPRMPSGSYNVTVTYTGDDKYLPSNNTATFNVTKVESFVIPVAQDIYVGDNEDITISVPEDATGTVTIVIDGEEYVFNLDDGTLGLPSDPNKVYTVAVSKGSGKLVISGLPRGEYVVSAMYNGDDKYLPSTNKTTFKVLRKSPSMDVTDLGNRTVIVDLPDGATGTVEIKVGNNTYNATVVNGRASIDLINETPGVHDIVVTYSGDETHEPQVADSKVTIPKYDTPISVDVDDCLVGDTAVITVTVPDNATGNVTIEINAKSYTAEIKDGKAIFHVTGLEAGDKTVAVRYDGDNNYVGNSTTGQFTVSKRPSTVSASGKDINVGKDEVITVIVPKDATGRVLVDINGVGYYGTIVNGKAKVLIPELPAGKYTAKVTYEGDDKYLPSTTTTKFTVTKVKTPIIATGDEIDQGQDATVVVKVPSDATGTVTITVDGKKYTAEVRNGKAVFYVPGLTKGDYKVTASYSGDKKYEANDTVTDIEVYFHESPYHNGGGEGAMGLSKHATGNPILVLLLVILAIGSTQIRRFRK